MPYPAQVIAIMIASPGDVATERNIVAEEIHRWNNAHSFARKLVLTPVRWETHTTPQMGNAPQEIINGQILDSADILVGIFGARVGTATEKYVSGTVEEIKRHVAAGKIAKLYFSDVPVSPSTIDPEQYAALMAFKQECKALGLYATYSDLDGFRSLFKNHLDIELNQPRYLWSSSLLAPIAEEAHQLSEQAKELLREASRSRGGVIIHRKVIGSESIQIGNKVYGNKSDRDLAKWRDALRDLLRKEFVEETKHGSDIFRLSSKGYEEADRLNAEWEDQLPYQLHAEISGPAEAQIIQLKANQTFTLHAIDFLTSTEACIASQSVEQEGENLDILLNHPFSVNLFNSPRPDRNAFDFSGPAKLRLMITAKNKKRAFILPVLIQPRIVNNTQWVTFTGSALFE